MNSITILLNLAGGQVARFWLLIGLSSTASKYKNERKQLKISDAVQNRVDDERTTLQNILATLPKDCSQRSETILLHDFWPEIKKGAKFTRTTNLAIGSRALDTLPYSDAPIIDIRADADKPEQEFIERTGMSFESIIPFAKSRLVIPIIYHSDPRDWIGFEEKLSIHPHKFNELISLSYLHKDRINAFCTKKDSAHSEIDQTTRDLLRGLPTVDETMQFSPTLSKDKRGDRAFIAIAQRIAYLHTFSPPDYSYAMNLLDDVKTGRCTLQEVSDFVHVKKWLQCSHLTAALGGEFKISGPMNQRVEQVEDDISSGIDKFSIEPKLGEREKEISEWIARKIMGAFKIEIFQTQHIDNLQTFLTNEKNFMLRQKILDGMENLYVLCYDNEGDDTLILNAHEIEETISEYRDRAKRAGVLFDKTSAGVDHVRYGSMGLGSIPIFEAADGFLAFLSEFLGPAKYAYKYLVAPTAKRVMSDAVIRRKLAHPNALRALKFDTFLHNTPN